MPELPRRTCPDKAIWVIGTIKQFPSLALRSIAATSATSSGFCTAVVAWLGGGWGTTRLLMKMTRFAPLRAYNSLGLPAGYRVPVCPGRS